jgi:acyl-CoA synthetase (AMP-forming)/AMP-acid ligase II
MIFRGDLLNARARLTPEKVALVSAESGERVTYRQLDERSEAAAEWLHASGLESGDRYGILALNCFEFIYLFLAARKSGLIAVPLSTRATPHEIEAIVRDCGMSALFYGKEFAAIAANCEGALSSPAIVRPIEDCKGPAHRSAGGPPAGPRAPGPAGRPR